MLANDIANFHLKTVNSSWDFHLRDGKKIGEASLEPGKYTATKILEGKGGSTSLHFNLLPSSGKSHNLYIVSKSDHSAETNTLVLSTILFSSK